MGINPSVIKTGQVNHNGTLGSCGFIDTNGDGVEDYCVTVKHVLHLGNGSSDGPVAIPANDARIIRTDGSVVLPVCSSTPDLNPRQRSYQPGPNSMFLGYPGGGRRQDINPQTGTAIPGLSGGPEVDLLRDCIRGVVRVTQEKSSGRYVPGSGVAQRIDPNNLYTDTGEQIFIQGASQPSTTEIPDNSNPPMQYQQPLNNPTPNPGGDYGNNDKCRVLGRGGIVRDANGNLVRCP